MIKDRKMRFLSSEDGIDYYLFTPSPFRLYFENRQDDAEHRHSITHILHMCAYLIRGGYNILYLSQNDEIISYIVFTRCKDWIVSGSDKNDYYTIFLWTYPKFRNRGMATKMAKYMLMNMGISFKNFYKTIAKNNYSSISVAEKSGFNKIGEANKVGKLHKIVPVKKGDCFLYSFKN